MPGWRRGLRDALLLRQAKALRTKDTICAHPERRGA